MIIDLILKEINKNKNNIYYHLYREHKIVIQKIRHFKINKRFNIDIIIKILDYFSISK